MYGKWMTFEEWSDLLFLREKLVPDTIEVDRQPWWCSGTCGQLMYGVEWIDGKLYPTSANTPGGMFISKEYSRVCRVCWEMYHALEHSTTGYWQGLSIHDHKQHKRLGPGGNYLAA